MPIFRFFIMNMFAMSKYVWLILCNEYNKKVKNKKESSDSGNRFLITMSIKIPLLVN